MAAYNGCAAYLQCVVEALLPGVAKVYHNAQPVHLGNHFFAESAHSVMCVTSLCTVADVVVAVVAQGYVHHSSLCEMLHVGKVAV